MDVQALFGVLATGAIYLVYCGYARQAVNTWSGRGEGSHISALAMVLAWTNFLIWSSWGAISEPPDWVRICGMLPGTFFAGLLLVQRKVAKPRRRVLVVIGATGTLSFFTVIWGAPMILAGNYLPVATIFGYTAASSSITTTIFASSAQFIRNKRLVRQKDKLTVSPLFLGLITVYCALWVTYGCFLSNYFMITAQGLGLVCWGAVTWQVLSARRICYPDPELLPAIAALSQVETD